MLWLKKRAEITYDNWILKSLVTKKIRLKRTVPFKYELIQASGEKIQAYIEASNEFSNKLIENKNQKRLKFYMILFISIMSYTYNF